MIQQYHGPFAAHFGGFEALMRSTGGQHLALLRTVKRFDRFLAHSYPQATTVTKDILVAWFASFDHLRRDKLARISGGQPLTDDL